MKQMNVLILSQKDIIALNITFEDCFNVIREALVQHGRKSVLMPPKFGIHPSKVSGAHCNAMPSYIPSLGALGIKWVCGFPGNNEKGYPYITGTLILNDDETGAPIAIMEASWITAMRTATVTGLVAQALSSEDSETIGLVGTGVQGRYGLKAILSVLPKLKRALIYDVNWSSMESFTMEMKHELDIEILSVATAEQALRNSDIMVTATSFVQDPYVKKEWVRKGDLGILVHHRGWENAIFHEADQLVIDDWAQTKSYGMEDGGFYGPLPEKYTELGEILAGLKNGRQAQDEKIIAITCGLSIEDMALGKMIYDKAIENKVGTYFSFI
jgi:ornithine cyclodeaminase/alanine dehydrogenase-like protein (mu-crystallin family)